MAYQSHLPGYVTLTAEQEKVLASAAEVLKKENGYTGPLNIYGLFNNSQSLGSEIGMSLAVATIVMDTIYQSSIEKFSNVLRNVSSTIISAVAIFAIGGLTNFLC